MLCAMRSTFARPQRKRTDRALCGRSPVVLRDALHLPGIIGMEGPVKRRKPAHDCPAEQDIEEREHQHGASLPPVGKDRRQHVNRNGYGGQQNVLKSVHHVFSSIAQTGSTSVVVPKLLIFLLAASRASREIGDSTHRAGNVLIPVGRILTRHRLPKIRPNASSTTCHFAGSAPLEEKEVIRISLIHAKV